MTVSGYILGRARHKMNMTAEFIRFSEWELKMKKLSTRAGIPVRTYTGRIDILPKILPIRSQITGRHSSL